MIDCAVYVAGIDIGVAAGEFVFVAAPHLVVMKYVVADTENCEWLVWVAVVTIDDGGDDDEDDDCGRFGFDHKSWQRTTAV